jgi:hypothetical protein
VALILSIQIRDESRLLQELEDSSHALLFGLAALFLLPGRKAGWRVYIAVAIATIALGICSEFMQGIGGKDAEIGDVFRDAAGATIFLGIAAAYQRKCSAWMRRLITIVGLAVMVSIFSSPLLTASAIIDRWHKFPVITDFSSPLSVRLCSASNAQFYRICVRMKFAALIKFSAKAPSSAFAVNGPFPDWSSYKSLVFRVDSELPNPITLNLRIHDAQHNNDYSDRYNAELLIRPGRNDIKIPLQAIERSPAKRRMDMKAMRTIALFVVQPEESFELLIDEFRLEEKN